MAHRIALWHRHARAIRHSLWRDSPLLIPNYSNPSIVRFNESLLRRRLNRNQQYLGLSRPFIWTYTPLAARLFDSDIHNGLVYHCVDDIAAFPGVDTHHFRRSEALLAKRADVCMASSMHLVNHLHEIGARDVRYWPNPADTQAFGTASSISTHHPIRRRPQVGFLGAVQEHKIDVELIQYCANALPHFDFIIAGPLGFGLGNSKLDPSSFPDNVTFMGRVARDDAPALVTTFDVGIIPYRLNAYTTGVFPMKVFEYLASGLPVVSTALPSLVGEVEHVNFATDPAQFVMAIQSSITTPVNPELRQTRMAYAERFSWDNRIDEAIELLRDLRARRIQ